MAHPVDMQQQEQNASGMSRPGEEKGPIVAVASVPVASPTAATMVDEKTAVVEITAVNTPAVVYEPPQWVAYEVPPPPVGYTPLPPVASAPPPMMAYAPPPMVPYQPPPMAASAPPPMMAYAPPPMVASAPPPMTAYAPPPSHSATASGVNPGVQQTPNAPPPSYQVRAANVIQNAWKNSRKRMQSPAQNNAPAPEQGSSTVQSPVQNSTSASAQGPDFAPSMVQSPVQSPSGEVPPNPESITAGSGSGSKPKPGVMNSAKTSMSQFKHLDEEAYAKEIESLSPEELTQLHGKISRKLVSASMGATHGALCAPITAGVSLASTGVNSRRVNVNYRRKKVIEARLVEIQAEKYKLRKRDYAIPAAILGASFGVASGAEGLFVEHIGTETAIHAATVGTENASEHASHKVREHRFAKKFLKSKASAGEPSNDAAAAVQAPLVETSYGASIPPPMPYQPVTSIVQSEGVTPGYFPAPAPPYHSGEELVSLPPLRPNTAIGVDSSGATAPWPAPEPPVYYPPPPPGLPGRSATAIGVVPTLGTLHAPADATSPSVVDQADVPASKMPQGPFAPPPDKQEQDHKAIDIQLSEQADKLAIVPPVDSSLGEDDKQHAVQPTSSESADSKVEAHGTHAAALNAPSSDTKQESWPDEKAALKAYEDPFPMPVPDGFQKPSPSEKESQSFSPPPPSSSVADEKRPAKQEEASTPYFPPPPGAPGPTKYGEFTQQTPTAQESPYFAPPPTYQEAAAGGSSRPHMQYPPPDTKFGYQMPMYTYGTGPNTAQGYPSWNAPPTNPGPYNMPPTHQQYGGGPPLAQGQYGTMPLPNQPQYGPYNPSQFNNNMPPYGNGAYYAPPPPPQNSGPYNPNPPQPYNIPAYNPGTYGSG